MNVLYYTCNMKSSGKYKRREKSECTLHRCAKSWEILRIYVFTKTWKLVLSQQLYLKINSGFMLERIPLNETAISESSQIRELHEAINF